MRGLNVHYPLRIGTRSSQLALAQTRQVCNSLIALNPALATPGAIITVCIRTTGDAILNRPLTEIGGKELFTKEIDEALLRGSIDVAVHSMKDVQIALPSGLTIAAILEREDPRDALISQQALCLKELSAGAVVGTASLRRRIQVLMQRPDLKVVPLRGNLQARLEKLASGTIDAVLLAVAGLRRLGLTNQITTILSPEIMLPAAGQGAIGVICRIKDIHTTALLQHLNHTPTAMCIAAERAFLAVLGGNCRTPIAAFAELVDMGMNHDSNEIKVRFRGLVAETVSSPLLVERCGSATQAVYLAEEAGQIIVAMSGLEKDR